MSGQTPRGLVVAIDGPAGVGKSTLARRMSVALGLPYVNTGLMYRALTARALREGLDLGDGLALRQAAREVEFDLFLVDICLVQVGAASGFGAFQHIDALRVDGCEQIIEVFRRMDVAGDQIVHLVIGEVSLFLASVDELLNVFVFIV